MDYFNVKFTGSWIWRYSYSRVHTFLIYSLKNVWKTKWKNGLKINKFIQFIGIFENLIFIFMALIFIFMDPIFIFRIFKSSYSSWNSMNHAMNSMNCNAWKKCGKKKTHPTFKKNKEKFTRSWMNASWTFSGKKKYNLVFFFFPLREKKNTQFYDLIEWMAHELLQEKKIRYLWFYPY